MTMMTESLTLQVLALGPERVLGVACLVISVTLIVLASLPTQRRPVWDGMMVALIFMLLLAAGVVVSGLVVVLYYIIKVLL